LIEISMMESLLDFQFEFLTTYHTSGELPRRSEFSNGNPLLSAPYGIYATADGYIAIAMVNIPQLARVLHSKQLEQYRQEQAFSHRDEIKKIIGEHLASETVAYWLDRLHAEDMWAMQVLDWRGLMEEEGYQRLGMEQVIVTEAGKQIVTTRCPIRVNGQKMVSAKAAPLLGSDRESIVRELLK
jgi:crotonobetainyl-CoA:carnitine CoA-transferase CaiB-like acyl-CoA transferase